jgi:chromate transport protein ChrA
VLTVLVGKVVVMAALVVLVQTRGKVETMVAVQELLKPLVMALVMVLVVEVLSELYGGLTAHSPLMPPKYWKGYLICNF